MIAKEEKKKPRDDFFWSEEKEPHLARRKAILKDHPEVKTLFGIDPNLKYWTVLLVAMQLVVGFFVGQLSWLPFLLVTFFVGATISAALFLAIHEITHNLAFKHPLDNNRLALFANIPIVFPYAISFQKYHAMHHWEQGKHGVDTDIPTYAEARFFRGFFGKLFWFVNQIVAYAVRPMVVKPIGADKWQVYNAVFQIAAISIYIWFAGWSALAYLLLSLFFAGSIHPTAGHFISEHYVFEEGQETYSYYGPLNKITFNVGYHNEHHDFPNIPGSRLPQLKEMAPDYYDNLHAYNSWTKVVYNFILNKDVGLFSRTKRK